MVQCLSLKRDNFGVCKLCMLHVLVCECEIEREKKKEGTYVTYAKLREREAIYVTYAWM